MVSVDERATSELPRSRSREVIRLVGGDEDAGRHRQVVADPLLRHVGRGEYRSVVTDEGRRLYAAWLTTGSASADVRHSAHGHLVTGSGV